MGSLLLMVRVSFVTVRVLTVLGVVRDGVLGVEGIGI